jgi:diadenosine tetraphosphate (Ap4A) HIT family hydrolase
MSSALFNSPQEFRSAFEHHLAGMLRDYDELGTFVLVLANASFDARVWKQLEGPLRHKYQRLRAEFLEREACGLVLDDAGDDLEVFRQLVAVGIARLKLTEFRFPGRWELQFNHLRSFRPARITAENIEVISARYNPDGFNFNRPYLRKEILWRGWLAGRNCALFYNKFPFVDLHGLLVPEPRKERPQLLFEEDNEYIWKLNEILAKTLPGIGFGYNSYGACASVNHLHFHMFQRDQVLPVADSRWVHNGGKILYPAACFRFDSAASSWRFIRELHHRNVGYNLVYLPGVLYCLPRLKQGSDLTPAWSSGFAWYEMAGGFTTFCENDFAAVDSTAIESALKAISIDPVCGAG